MLTKPNKSVNALYTDIGRGHPNYLDSTLRALQPIRRERSINIDSISVFDISKFPALWGWKAIRKIYQTGPQNEILSGLYNRIRGRQSKHSGSGMLFRLLARDILQYYQNYKGFILAAHPLLVQLLGKDKRVIYIHGEIAAPREFDLSTAEKICVPLKYTAERMIEAGVPDDKIEITGLMLEPELEDKRSLMISNRKDRIKSGNLPVIGCFNSGAYPRRHVDEIIKLIGHILHKKQGRVILSAGNDKNKFESIKKYLTEFRPCFIIKEFLDNHSNLLILHDQAREQLTLQEIKILELVDMLVMAAHERVNWCLGLEIPAILLTPHYGNFARQNYEFTAANGLVYDNPDVTKAFNSFLNNYRNTDPKLTVPKDRFETGGAAFAARSITKLIESE